MAGKPPAAPGRGALDGIKKDIQRAKDAGEAYDPRGIGNAFTHNFLNQKPWHPLNFRNQIKKFDAEQKAIQDAKLREQALEEFQAEQEAMQTMSYLSEAEQQRYKDRQSISFMYAKPPGLEAALLKEQAAEAAKAKAAAEAAAAAAIKSAGPSVVAVVPAAPGALPQQVERELASARMRELDRVREDPYAAMLAAREALAANTRLQIKGGRGGSPVHGGFTTQDTNQQLLDGGDEAGPGPSGSLHPGGGGYGGGGQVEVAPGVVVDAEDLAVMAGMSESEKRAVVKRLRKMQEAQERERKLREAEAVLAAAGYDVAALAAIRDEKSRIQKKGKHKHKSKTKSKSKDRDRDRERGTEREKERERERDDGKASGREKSKERGERDRERGRESDRGQRQSDRGQHQSDRGHHQSDTRERGRSRSRSRGKGGRQEQGDKGSKRKHRDSSSSSSSGSG